MWIAVIALVVGAVVYVGVRGTQKSDQPPVETVTSSQTALNKLYAEAKRDLKNKKLADAGAKFRQLANMDPGFKDADAQAKAIAAELLKQAEKKEIDGKPGDNPPAPPADTARAIPADATPQSLLIDDISGYETVQNGWLKKPVEAGSTFLPIPAEVKSQIDRVLWTIAKTDSNQAAEARLKDIKDAWPLDHENITINGHTAYAGIYNFENAPQFKLRQMATIAWTRNEWFFMIEVLPKGTPDSAYKKGVARDVAVNLGY